MQGISTTGFWLILDRERSGKRGYGENRISRKEASRRVASMWAKFHATQFQTRIDEMEDRGGPAYFAEGR
jgi:hypothetical protein